MTREEFFEWLDTCPTYSWYNIGEGEHEGCIRIVFEIEEEEDDDEYGI